MLLLDAEALSAVAHGPAVRRDRVRALVGAMRRRDLGVGTVTAVLAEVVRGRRQDAAVFSAVRRERVLAHPVDEAVAVRAGQLLGARSLGSEHAVDAFLVAVALLGGGAVIATGDPDDIARLVGRTPGVDVAAI